MLAWGKRPITSSQPSCLTTWLSHGVSYNRWPGFILLRPRKNVLHCFSGWYLVSQKEIGCLQFRPSVPVFTVIVPRWRGPLWGLMIGDIWCPKMISNQDHNKCHPEEILRAVDGLAEMLFDLLVHPTLPAAPPPPDLSSPAYDQLCSLFTVGLLNKFLYFWRISWAVLGLTKAKAMIKGK